MKYQENHETGGKKMEKETYKIIYKKKKHCFGQQFKIQCWDSVCLHTSKYTIQKQMYTTGLNFINLLIIKHTTTYKQSQ